jgi:hypothetical protein
MAAPQFSAAKAGQRYTDPITGDVYVSGNRGTWTQIASGNRGVSSPNSNPTTTSTTQQSGGQNFQYGGWYWKPELGRAQRWFNGVWTDGEEPKAQASQQSQSSSSTTKTVAQQVQDLLKEQENQVNERMNFVRQFLKDNPFAFDEAQAKQLADAKFRPYYEQELADFVEPLKEKISRTTEDRDRMLGELVRRRELGTTQKTRDIEAGLNKAREGFAGRGLLGSGSADREANVQEIKGNENLQDFITQGKFTEQTTQDQANRDIADFNTDINKKNRDIFGSGRAYDTAVTGEVEKQRGTNIGQNAIRAEDAFTQRFGTGYVNNQRVSELAKSFLA